MMRRNAYLANWLLTILLAALFQTTVPSINLAQQTAGPIDLELAKQYFSEAEKIFEQDGGALWKMSLSGPMLFVDPATRTVVANSADPGSVLRKSSDVFIGKIPNHVMVANTSVEWSGQKWTMLMWPLPRDQHKRGTLLAHEAWHRIQDELGYVSSGAANNHLDSLQGRYLMQLEWRALARAIEAGENKRGEFVADALSFRALRQSKFNSQLEEASMEMHEGLAEYTGIRLAVPKYMRRAATSELLNTRPSQIKTYVRSFAYLSGPAYGLLLDDAMPSWLTTLKSNTDLAESLRAAMHIELPNDLATFVAERSEFYDGKSLFRIESDRDAKNKRLLAENKAKFISGPRLEIPIHRMNMSFNPNTTVPLEEYGTVYRKLEVSDQWGIIKVNDGAMISRDFKRIVVSIPEGYNAQAMTKAWKIELAEGWVIQKSKTDVFRLIQKN